jgi:hypothetical protein
MYYGMVFTSSLHHGFDKALGAVMAAFATLNTHAAETYETGEGTLFRSLFGDTLEKDYGIQVSNLLDIAYVRNNRSTHDEREHLRLREIETFCSPIAFGLLFVKVNLKLSRKLVRKSETF